VYPEIDFEHSCGYGRGGHRRDSYDRYMVRMREMKESARSSGSACTNGAGTGDAKVPGPKAETGRSLRSGRERARDMGWYCVSDGTPLRTG